MYHHIAVFCLLALFVSGKQLYGQDLSPVHFRFGVELFPDNYETERQKSPEILEITNGRYVRYIRSARLLSTAERKVLEESGAQILEYISFGVYLISFPEHFDLGHLGKLDVRSIIPVKPVWKLARNLREPPYGEWAVFGDRVAVNMQLYPHVNIDSAVDFCKKNGLEIIKTGNTAHFIQVLVRKDALESTAALPVVQYMELVSAPGVPEDTQARSLHRANMLDSDAPSGKKYNGTGVNVLIRDDGQIAPHIDLKGRLKNFSIGPPQNHGIGVGGIITGAGNIDPTKKGMAAGAKLFAIDYTNEFQDATIDLFLNENTTITNSSYGDGLGCNGGYTLNTQIVDGQMYDHPTLLHVFSAGNSNGIDCGANTYGAGGQWGNITGGHKQGKNSIATANLLSNITLDNSSSRGPAYDGRIKPDISAAGNNVITTAPNNSYQNASGTSVAAPGVTGCLAQLTQAFKTLNSVEPPAALLKTLILNSANDLGNAGPDYKFGWGHLNAGRALRHIEEDRWYSNSIDNGATSTYNLEIPSGVRRAKVMLYWAEMPASEQAAKALINDLDITLTGADGTVYRPWKLDPTPDPVILNTPATRGRDSLNNVEQVAIDNPPAGTYTVNITGTEVPLGPQTFFLAWDFLTDSVTLTYPNGGEGFVPGETERLHWDAFGNTENFVLQYSTDDVPNWQTITTVSGSLRYYDWVVPNTISGKARIRIQRGPQTDTSDAMFNIVPTPQNIEVTKVCPDSIYLNWTDVQDTLSYDVYLPGAKYMEIVGSSASNSISIPIGDPHLEKWVSVRCTSASGITGRRAIAVNWPGGLKNCPLEDDIALQTGLPLENDTLISCGSVSYDVAALVRNDGLFATTNATINYQVDNQAVVAEPLPEIEQGAALYYIFQNKLELTDNQSVDIKIWTSYPAEDYTYNDTVSYTLLYITDPADTYFTEDFENSDVLPGGWLIKNPDGQDQEITWTLSRNALTGADGMPTRALFLDCFSYNSTGQEDYVYLRPLDLSSSPNAGITFDIAHATYNGTSVENLRLEVFPDCDLMATPVVIWEKSDPQLSTVAGLATEFHPDNAQDWRSESVGLQQFAGQSIIVRFASVNDFGNSLYLDNISLIPFDSEAPQAAFSIMEDSICRNDTIYFASSITGSGTTNYTWNFGAGSSPSTATGSGPHAVRYLLLGTKTPRLIASNLFGADTAFQQLYVKPFPVANFTSEADELTVSFTSTALYAGSYYWDFGDGDTSTLQNPVHTYVSPGNYVVKLSATNECSTVDKSAALVLTTGTSDLSEQMDLRILPNPTDGDFRVEWSNPKTGPIRFTLLDVRGRLVKTIETTGKQPVTSVSFENLHLAKGVYQLNVSTESGFRTFSVVVL